MPREFRVDIPVVDGKIVSTGTQMVQEPKHEVGDILIFPDGSHTYVARIIEIRDGEIVSDTANIE